MLAMQLTMSGTQSHLIIISYTIRLCSRDIYSCLLIIIGEFFPLFWVKCVYHDCATIYSLLYFLFYDIVCIVFVLIVITCIIVIIAF